MPEQRRIGYKWNLRALIAQRNLWKTTELLPLLQSRGINLSESQVYRLVSPGLPNAFQHARSPHCATSWTVRPTTCSSRSSK